MKHIKWRQHNGYTIANDNHYDIIKCKTCKFNHVVPIPTTKVLQKVYSDKYYTVEKPFYIKSYLKDKKWWNAIYEDRFKTIEKYLGKKTGRLLDIGSGPGLFLAYGEKRGWRAKGIEPSKKAYAYSKKVLRLDVENIFLEKKTAKKLGKFDAIHMGEVLEHLPDPGYIVELIKEMLNPGGILTVVTPNDFNPVQKTLQKLAYRSWWVKPPYHLNYFCHNSLKELVKRKGFKVMNVSTTFPIDFFLLMGENYINNGKKGRRVHALRKKFDLNLIETGNANLRSRIYNQLAKINIGRETVLYAKKQKT